MGKRRFICAINRDRDGYQVPLALNEAGLLARFVTDFYAGPRAPSWLPQRVRNRAVAGLPRGATRSSWLSFVTQTTAELLKRHMPPVFAVTDAMLCRAAARQARLLNAHLYCYAPYMPEEQLIQPGTKRIIFDYHPLPQLLWDILSEDHARYPQTEWSFSKEARLLDDIATFDVWRRADAVVCASDMTRRSLIRAGCDAERITVIPYGFDAAAHANAGDDLPRRAQCEFLFVGQGIQRKGLHHLILAWDAAKLVGARLTLVCDKRDPGIMAMIDDPTIRLLGRQAEDDLDRLYREADVFVMPSLIEGFGLVYLEALARGCFVIGTQNTGLPDMALPAFAASVLPSGDLGALERALVDAAARFAAGTLDRAAIRAASSKWSWTDFRHAIAHHARAVLDG